MRAEPQVQAAHDRLIAILLGEVPNPFPEDPSAEIALKAAVDVLCWALEHEHNKEFGENLRRIDEFLEEAGLTLEKIADAEIN